MCLGARSSVAGSASTAAQFLFNGAPREADTFGNQSIAQSQPDVVLNLDRLRFGEGGLTVSAFVLATERYRDCCSSLFLFWPEVRQIERELSFMRHERRQMGLYANLFALPRQFRRPHQIRIDRTRALAALFNDCKTSIRH